jgi:hypothetical protein
MEVIYATKQYMNIDKKKREGNVESLHVYRFIFDIYCIYRANFVRLLYSQLVRNRFEYQHIIQFYSV